MTWLAKVAISMAMGAATFAHAGTSRADDRSATLALLQTLEPTTDPAAKQSRDALERGTRMRGAGDDAHARLAEGLALEWARLASDRARTLAVEKEARALEVLAIENGARVERERALLEEAIARSGRLRAELTELHAKGGANGTKEHAKTFVGTADVKKTTAAPKAGGHAPPPAPGAAHVDADAPRQDAAQDAARPAGGTR
jgi:hypothetical protein